MDTWIWIIIAVVLVLIIIGIVMALSKGAKAKRVERDRAEAEQLRREAAERERRTRESEATAAATDADARAAAAEADRQAAEAERKAAEAEQRRIDAERLEEEARAKSAVADEDRRSYEDKLREADVKDPDVPTDREGRRVEDADDLGRRGGQAPQVPPARDGTDEDARVGRVVLHPDAVAEERATGEGRARVDREDGDPLPLRPKGTDERVRRRRLPDAGRPRQPDDMGAPGVRHEGGHDLRQRRVPVLDERDETGDGTRRPRRGRLDQGGDVDGTCQRIRPSGPG